MRNLFIHRRPHRVAERSILHAWLARRKRAVGWECSQEDGYWFAAHLMATGACVDADKQPAVDVSGSISHKSRSAFFRRMSPPESERACSFIIKC